MNLDDIPSLRHSYGHVTLHLGDDIRFQWEEKDRKLLATTRDFILFGTEDEMADFAHRILAALPERFEANEGRCMHGVLFEEVCGTCEQALSDGVPAIREPIGEEVRRVRPDWLKIASKS